MFGASWGLRLTDVTPIAKLVAIRLGDGCDTDAKGIADLNDLEEWCCATKAEVFESLALLTLREDVVWHEHDGDVSYTLPWQAKPPPREPARPDTSITFLYIISGRLGRKIGITADLGQRLTALRTATLDDTLLMEWSVRGVTPLIRKAEGVAHRLLAAKAIRSEWFNVTLEEARSAIMAALEEASREPR